MGLLHGLPVFLAITVDATSAIRVIELLSIIQTILQHCISTLKMSGLVKKVLLAAGKLSVWQVTLAELIMGHIFTSRDNLKEVGLKTQCLFSLTSIRKPSCKQVQVIHHKTGHKITAKY